MGSDLMINPTLRTSDRCSYLGASDARTMLGKDEKALFRLWQEKRGEIEPEDLSGNLLVLFGCATEELNRRWFDRETGHSIGAVQRFLRHPKLEWMGATVDGIVPDDGAVFEAKFMLPRNFAEDVAADKHMAQLQHNMLVTGSRPDLSLPPDRLLPLCLHSHARSSAILGIHSMAGCLESALDCRDHRLVH